MKVYKLFRKKKDGKLYPLYVRADKVVEITTFLRAEAPDPTKDGKVRSKLGKLAYRPGWHSCEVPFADHIGKKKDGKLVQRKNNVWCECEIVETYDYTESLKSISKSPKKRMMKVLPQRGYYFYQTNPNAKVRWIISDNIIVKRELSNEEVDKLCRGYGIEPQERET